MHRPVPLLQRPLRHAVRLAPLLQIALLSGNTHTHTTKKEKKGKKKKGKEKRKR
jgi:hypothetical protein